MRYENWRELALECQKSGVSVQSWCKRKNISVTTCRQWLKKLRKQQEVLLLGKNANQNIDLPLWGKVDLKESIKEDIVVSSSDSKNSICLKYHDWSVELNSSFNPVLLKQIIKVLESVC